MEEKKVAFCDGDQEFAISEDCYNKLTKANIKHYLGDIKWVLYQYICDLQERHKYCTIYMTCGNFAYSKLTSMSGFIKYVDREYDTLNINGEEVKIRQDGYMNDKKQIDILVNEYSKDKEIVTLYFA